MPGDGAYEFAILQLLHQLSSVCNQIALYAGNNHESTPDQLGVLFWELHAHTFRGITLGVASLAWHCLGFNPGCPREQAVKVLCYIRENGPVTKKDLLLAKGARIDATTRNTLLKRLAAEDLIRVDGKVITATTFDEFVAALHSRAGLPEAESFVDLLKKDEVSAD